MQDRIANHDLPQGFILIPLLFNLHDIFKYADDIAIFCSHESIVYIKNQLNLALGNLSLSSSLYCDDDKGIVRSVLDWGYQVFHPLNDKEYVLMSRLQSASFYESRTKVEGVDRVGFTVVIHHLDLIIKNRFCDLLSIFNAELLALECALHQISTLNFPKAIIFSDSLSVLNSLSSLYYRGNSHPAVYKIKYVLHSFNKSGRRVGFCWIPAHRGIPGNERADAATKESLLPDFLLLAKCHYTNLYSRFKRKAKIEAITTIKKEVQNKGRRCFNKIEIILVPPWNEVAGIVCPDR
ncbi:hypothetical protein ACFW04_012364 [Cataglyphis niger]